MGREPAWHPMVSQAADMLSKMLEADESQRITSEDLVRHPFLTSEKEAFEGTDYAAYKKAQMVMGLRGGGAGVSETNPRVVMRYR
ncbi:hypothetical protein HK104_004722 [Borealophlyctis nickersoniae]|nr:hypothetical protein HK104_004722 [Borealophlyctis nickersoniae]